MELAPRQSHILIVDDEHLNAWILVKGLEKEYRLTTASSGPEALEMVKQDPPDIILLDVQMPGMNGHEVCTKLKDNSETKDIPVIFITALGRTEDEARGLELGAVDYIVKPFKITIVKSRLKTHLALKHAQEELAKQNQALREMQSLREQVEQMNRHDLKIPLTTILGLPKLMLTDDPTPKQTKRIKRIEEAGYRMLEMINLSLDLYKMEMGTYKLQAEIMDIMPVLLRIIEECGPLSRANNNLIDVFIQDKPAQPDSSFMIRGEELLLYSMLSNLIKNSLEASPENEHVRITLSNDNDSQSYRINIHNQGAVPKEIRKSFFDKYATSGKQHGTGLGTYSAMLIAKTHEGSISLTTSDENGTGVSVLLPKE